MKMYEATVEFFDRATKTGNPSKWGMRIEVTCKVEANSQAEAKERAMELLNAEKFDMFTLKDISMTNCRCVHAKSVKP